MIKRLVIVVLVWTFAAGPIGAQDEATILSLESEQTNLQTGQAYEVTIRLNNVSDLWLSSMEIAYDPALMYIIGTRSGSPVSLGDFFPGESTLVFQNSVQRDVVTYTISLLSPAEPLNGSGVVGRFRIYPIAPGETQLLFRQASITAQGPNREPITLDFTPVLLQLNVQGTPVEPPSEATATPTATASPTEADESSGNAPTERPTLVNATAAPGTAITVPATTQTEAESTSLLPLAVGMMVIGALGLLILGTIWLRNRRQ